MSLPTDKWTKSSFSRMDLDCVDVKHSPGAILVRNSKVPDGPFVSFTEAEWLAFIAGVKADEFDLPC